MPKPDFGAAQAAYIERDDIVVRVAKIIDPGAFETWYRSTNCSDEPVPPDTRKKYMQSRAIALAAEILKLAAATEDLPKQLADSEAAHWELIGVPANDPELRKVIDAKYARAAVEDSHPA